MAFYPKVKVGLLGWVALSLFFSLVSFVRLLLLYSCRKGQVILIDPLRQVVVGEGGESFSIVQLNVLVLEDRIDVICKTNSSVFNYAPRFSKILLFSGKKDLEEFLDELLKSGLDEKLVRKF